MRKIWLFIIAGIALCCQACSGKEGYGLCVISADGYVDSNAHSFFPMHSVMKFPQALYVANNMLRNNITLDSTIVVHKTELMQDTWSPMLEMMGEEGSFSFRELMRLSLIESDNNACDLLFQLFGMPDNVDSFVKGLGFKDINVMYTERQMHEDTSLASANCCTPLEMTRLLLWFNEHKDDNTYFREVWDIMSECKTGADRIPAAFEPGCKIIHKTGTGFDPKKGLPQINDAAIVLLPDGQTLAIAIFIPDPDSDSDISEIVKKALRTLATRKKECLLKNIPPRSERIFAAIG